MNFRHCEPLFSRHDLSSELDRMRESGVSALKLFHGSEPKPSWIREAMYWAKIDILWLDPVPIETLSEPSIEGAETTQEMSWYSRRYRFIGDARLWHMNPGDRQDLPIGEIDGEAISLAVLARSEAQAQARFEMQFARIWELIDMQCRRIAQFEDELYDLIKSRLVSECACG